MDSSALVKLLVDEPESQELWAAVEGQILVASALVEVEVPRAMARRGLDPSLSAVRVLLGGLVLLELDVATLRRAALLPPATLRSLDALHLAAALTVRDRITAVVAYDQRLSAAAQDHGLLVLSPGRIENG